MTSSHAQDIALLPAYLVVGEDALKRAAVMRRLRTRLSKCTDLSLNAMVFHGENAQGKAVVSACNTLPFAGSVRLVEVRSIEKLRKDDSEALIAYLGKPNPTTVLALVGEKLAKNTRLYKAVQRQGKTAIIDCATVKRFQLPAMIGAMAQGYGITISEGAANQLIDLVGEDTQFLDSELKKMALAHRGSDPINEHEVLACVSRIAEVKPWEFVDAFSARDLGKCVLYYKRMKTISPHALLALCTTRIRELICAHSLMERGGGYDLAAELKLAPWRVKNHEKWTRGFSPAELRGALIAARDTERAMKSGADPRVCFFDWVVAIITGKIREHLNTYVSE